MRKALALSIPCLLLSAACSYDNGDARRVVFEPNQPVECGTQAHSTIDVGREIEVDKGTGAGVYVEYAAGGHWHIRTSCDTDRTGASCPWDVLVAPEDKHELSNFEGEDLEANDSLQPFPDYPDTFQLAADTGSDLDGFTFDGDPGAAISLDVLLDQTCTQAVHFVFWVGDGALHSGSPSNPLILIPSPE